MTQQQKLLWEKLTKDVAQSGEGNLRARELYDELCKIMEMDDKVILSLTETDQGIEVRINEGAYGNLAVVGLLEKIKLAILDNEPEKSDAVYIPTINKQKYDA